MAHGILVAGHVIGALLALATGAVALRFANGARGHRAAGRLYLAGWTMLALSGALIGLRRPGLSPFEVLNSIGYACVLYAYALVIYRRRIGPGWLSRHYSWMLSSYAAVVVATANQAAMHLTAALGLAYPIWVFWLMVIAPAFVLPAYGRRLEARYGGGAGRPGGLPGSRPKAL